ncbi:MAG: CPBP family intramembrane metalloprotease [Xanthobacteraceae bacterium]|nr:CPBP family intramembrane metalloprotease [Xanthobacteraceae bacterium]
MSSVDIATEPLPPVPERSPHAWKFWGTLLWGLVIFAAMFVGQALAVVVMLVVEKRPFAMSEILNVVGNGWTLSLSVVMGLPAVLAAIWLATRLARMSFADYLAVQGFSWKLLLAGALALAVLIEGWDLVARATGRDVTSGFMGGVMKSAQDNGAFWLLIFAFCVAAPMSEEFFARGFLYRGWSESFLRPAGAIVLSSLVWTSMHLQYDWFFLGEVFSIGLLFGYLRYRSNSIWLTVILHGLNNLAATVQTLWLLGS